MKNTLFALIMMTTISSCNFFSSNNISSTYNSNYEYYEVKDDSLQLITGSINGLIPDDYWVFTGDSNFGGGLSEESKSFLATDTIPFDVILDISLANNWSKYESSVNTINTILKNLNSGYAIKFNLVNSTENLSRHNTEGRLNQNNIFEVLGERSAKDQIGDGEFKLFLFKDSKFFNTANAVCLPHGKNRYIFGDGNLLHSPMLFIHELGHALGLTHYNKKPYDGCESYNVMHESNIGCALHFTRRQIMLVHSGKYVPPIVDEEKPIACDCNHNNINSIEEEYLNSIDRNIDDTPIVSNYLTMFTDTYIEELKNGTLDIQVENSLVENFGKEWDALIINSTSISKPDYIKERLEVHKKLRKNNLTRWLREINMANNPSFNENTNYFNTSENFIAIKLEEINAIRCNAVLNSIINLANNMNQYLDILEENPNIKNCYDEAIDSIFTLFNQPLDGQVEGLRQDNSTLKFTKDILETSLRKDARQALPNVIRSRRKK